MKICADQVKRDEEEFRRRVREAKPYDLIKKPDFMSDKEAFAIYDEEIARRSNEGRKDDQDKARHDLLAPEFLTGTAEILTFGAAKYGERNWEHGMAWSRPFAAMMRHMWAWWAGEQNDAETGKSHLWHAACCLMFLVAYEARNKGRDDRPNTD